jgi:hypothetical protein
VSDPIISPSDLATYLNDPSLNVDRAVALIADAQMLCEAIISPLPAGASVVVKRMAGRAYVAVSSPRQAAVAAAGGQYGATPGGNAGVFLWPSDEIDLRRLAGSGGAFSIDLLPADYAPPASWSYLSDWDQIT